MTTTGVREALADLAESAPVPDLAGAALSGARARRRRRLVLTPLAVTAVAAAAWLLPGSVIRWDAADLSPAGAAVGYDPNIATPWLRLHDLPLHLDEPLAFTYSVLGGDERVVSASGEQWRLPDAHTWVTPSVAPDGRKVVWYDASDHELIIRDLAGGTERRIAATFSGDDGTVAIAPDLPVLWSPDGDRLALTSTQPGVSIVDVESGVVTETYSNAQALGWRDDETVVGLSQDPAAVFTDVVTLTADGSRVSVGQIQLDGIDDFPAPFALSPDGKSLGGVVVAEDGRAQLTSWTLRPEGCAECTPSVMMGYSLTSVPASPTQPAPQWVTDTEMLVAAPSGAGELFEAADNTGAVRPLVVMSSRLGAVELHVVPSVVATGPSEPLHTSRWWWGWYVDRIVYGVVGALLIALIGFVAAHRRRHVAR